MSRVERHQSKKREKKKRRIKLSSRQKKIIAAVLAVVIFLGVAYGGKIIKLKAENRELKQQQQELTSEKSKLTKELKNIHSKEYIQEQARKQLRLLNKDEILFIFKDEEESK